MPGPFHDLDWTNPINRRHPLNRGLRGWWLGLPYRARGSRWVDLVANQAADLVRSNPTTDWQTMAPERNGVCALLCDNPGSSGANNTGKFCTSPNSPRWQITGRVRFRRVSRTSNTGLLGKFRTNDDATGAGISQRSYLLYFQTNNRAAGIVSANGTTNTSVTGNASLTVDRWYDLALVYVPGTSLTLYVDGVQDNQNTLSIPAAIFDSTANVMLGCQGGNFETASHDGWIQGARVQAAALTASEIGQLYREGLVGYPNLLKRRNLVTGVFLSPVFTRLERGVRGLSRGLVMGARG